MNLFLEKAYIQFFYTISTAHNLKYKNLSYLCE